MRIEEALSPYAYSNQINVDLSSKKVIVETDTPPEILIRAIESVGYQVERDH